MSTKIDAIKTAVANLDGDIGDEVAVHFAVLAINEAVVDFENFHIHGNVDMGIIRRSRDILQKLGFTGEPYEYYIDTYDGAELGLCLYQIMLAIDKGYAPPDS